VHPLLASGIRSIPPAGMMLIQHPGRVTLLTFDAWPPGARSHRHPARHVLCRFRATGPVLAYSMSIFIVWIDQCHLLWDPVWTIFRCRVRMGRGSVIFVPRALPLPLATGRPQFLPSWET